MNKYTVEFSEDVIVLDFSETPYRGVEVRAMADVELGDYLAFFDLLNSDRALDAYKIFAENMLMDWNLRDKSGEDIPPNMEGLRSIPLSLGRTILRAWLRAISELPSPLEEASPSGGTSGARLMSLAGSSESLGNSNGHG